MHPDEWARGLAEALISCAADNGASRAVIMKNDGVRIDTIDADGKQVKRYRVVTEKA